MTTGDPAALIGSTEAARILKIHRSAVARWVEKGWLKPAHKMPSATGAYLFTAEEVEKVRRWQEIRSNGPAEATA